jgi:hypothetical protein
MQKALIVLLLSTLCYQTKAKPIFVDGNNLNTVKNFSDIASSIL